MVLLRAVNEYLTQRLQKTRSRVGWNKRSGSTKREGDIFKIWFVINVHLALPFDGEWLFFIVLLVEPLRLFHPTGLFGVE